MRLYSTYKDSGVSWIGKIPEHWGISAIKRVAKFNPKRTKEIYQEVGYVPMECIKNGILHPRVININEISSGLTYFEEGDLVVAKVTPCFENGNIAIAKGLLNGCAYGTSEIFVFRCFDIYDRFLFYYFQENRFKHKCCSTMTGTGGLKRVSSEFVRNSPIPVPPLHEQQAIVSFLDEKVSEINDFIVKQEKQIELLKEWRQGEILRVMTKGLNPEVKMKNSGIGWIGKIPEQWETKRFGSAFIESREINSKLEYLEAYKFYYGSLIRKDIDVDPMELVDTYGKYTIIRTNDIVINGLNLNYDFVSQRVAKVYSDGIITSAYLVFRPRYNVNHQFYLYFFKAMDNLKLFHGMGSGIRLTLSYSDLKNQPIVCPPPSEQQEIVEYIERKTTEVDKLIVELTYQVEYLKEYKQRLISDVVTGKINVQPE